MFATPDGGARPGHEVVSQYIVSGALASRCTKVILVVIVLYCELPEL